MSVITTSYPFIELTHHGIITLIDMRKICRISKSKTHCIIYTTAGGSNSCDLGDYEIISEKWRQYVYTNTNHTGA